MDYKEKYIKYKTKYFNLKKQIGGYNLSDLNCILYDGKLDYDMEIYLGSLNDNLEIKDRILKDYDDYEKLNKYKCPKNPNFLQSLKDNKRISDEKLIQISKEINQEWLEIVMNIGKKNMGANGGGYFSIEKLEENINKLTRYKKLYYYCNSPNLNEGRINIYKLYEYINRDEDDYFDILIIGAGPVGILLTIILLERYDNIKILLLDNRTTFSIKGNNKEIIEKLVESENIEGERQPFNLLISFFIFGLSDFLNNIIPDDIIMEIENSKGTYCSVVLNNYIKIISKIKNGSYKNRLRIMYSKKESPEVLIKKYNINIVLDVSAGNSDIAKNHDNLQSIPGLYEKKEIINYYYTKLIPSYNNDPYQYQIFNYVENNDEIKMPTIEIDGNFFLRQHKKKVIKYLEDLKKKNIQRDWYIQPREEINDKGEIEISKKNICKYNDNYISIICGSGLIKSAPTLGQTLNFSIGAFVCIVLKQFDKLFKINKNLIQKENLYIEKKTIFIELLHRII